MEINNFVEKIGKINKNGQAKTQGLQISNGSSISAYGCGTFDEHIGLTILLVAIATRPVVVVGGMVGLSGNKVW